MSPPPHPLPQSLAGARAKPPTSLIPYRQAPALLQVVMAGPRSVDRDQAAKKGAGKAQAAASAAAAASGGATCEHANIVRADGEMVCTSCGMVIDDDALAALHGCHDHDAQFNASLPQSWGGDGSESKPNLYVSNALGTANAIPKMQGMQLVSLYCKGGLETAKDRRNKNRLSKFSNACEKMKFAPAQAQTAWTLFQRAAKDASPRKTAESAAWAVYKTCQMYSIPATSDEILGVIKSNFGRKTMPNMLKILYSHMPSADDSLAAHSSAAAVDGASAAAAADSPDATPEQRSGGAGAPSSAAAGGGSGGGNSNSNDQYYFALNMRRMLKGRKFSKEMFSSAKNDAWKLYTEVFRTGNPNIRARRSIMMAFRVGS